MESQNKYKFSVFTCTYNRANLLPRVYESLRAQSFRDFEWILIDNGSTDNTQDVIAPWLAAAEFPIRHIKHDTNRGLQARYNEGIDIAQGEFWLSLDSDDACNPDTLETFYALWNEIPDADKPNFCGVTVNCQTQHGELDGDLYPEDLSLIHI